MDRDARRDRREGQAKPWWTSKTILTNGIAAVASIAGVFGLDVGLDAQSQAGIVGGVMAGVNILLRLVTDRPVGLGRD